MSGFEKLAGRDGQASVCDDRIRLMLVTGGLGLGGAETVVRDLARNLDTNRFELSICCTKGLGFETDQELLSDGFDVFGIPQDPDKRVDYLVAPKLWKEIERRRIDIVHTHATSALFDAAPCRPFLRTAKLVHTFHYGNYPYDARRYHLMEYVCARAPDRLVAVGIEQRKQVRRTYRLPEKSLETIWNGVSVREQVAGSSFRDEIGTGNRLLVGTIATLIEQKGLDDLLEVASQCNAAQLPVQFAVVGEGPLRAKLERRRHELGLDQTVVFTGWIKNAASVALPEFDVFFQPSRWEAMSIVILEAMAAGKAIVATNVGDNAHVLEHEKSGLLVESGDISAMTAALTSLRGAENRSKIGEAAVERFESMFTVQHMVDRYEKLYMELVQDRK